jgi:hypothetical protein
MFTNDERAVTSDWSIILGSVAISFKLLHDGLAALDQRAFDDPAHDLFLFTGQARLAFDCVRQQQQDHADAVEQD